MPTPTLVNLSPFDKLFGQPPNYTSLRSFGSLCYPWIRPYTNHKLDPRSTPCVYLGESLTNHCHMCYDPVASKMYLSRDVVFLETDFPFKNIFKHLKNAANSINWDLSIPTPATDTMQHPSLEASLPDPLPTAQQRVAHTPLTASSTPMAPSTRHGMLLPFSNSIDASCSTHHTPTFSPEQPPTHSINPYQSAQPQPSETNPNQPPALPQSLEHCPNPTTCLPITSFRPAQPHPPDHDPNQSTSHPINPAQLPTAPLEQPKQTAPPRTSTSKPKPHTLVPLPHTDPPPIHRPVTRSQNKIFKPKPKANIIIPQPPSTIPSTVTQAKKHKVWREAMQVEFDALIDNRTWDLVPHDPSKNIVACRWLFRIKRKADGSIDRYKARLVAKGFTQRPGIDYHATFSPVVKPTTIRLVLSIAVTRNWSLRQLDVNNAFLQGELREEVYMSQPPGFESSTHSSYMCKLKKAIYGLKQAPLAWYMALSDHLVSIGFVKCKSDPSLFINHSGDTQVFVLVYVDDIILTGSKADAIDRVIHSLASRFSLKDLGSLHYFLGIEVTRTSHGIMLNQSNYIEEMLSSEDMHECKAASTPMSSAAALSLHDGASSCDATRYRVLLGKLQYLSFTRPDLSYSVNKLSQFMHQPSELHWRALKRILRYLRGTASYGLHLQASTDCNLYMYTDADWAGDVDGRNSTSCHMLFLGQNPISWSSKKQQTVARSSTEAEFKAVANSASEVCWVRNLLTELHCYSTRQPTIFCDNVGVLYLSKNPTINTRMKHVAVDFHYVRNLVQQKQLHVEHVHAKDQIADTLTKPLPKLTFGSNRCKLGVISNPKLEGGV